MFGIDLVTPFYRVKDLVSKANMTGKIFPLAQAYSGKYLSCSTWPWSTYIELPQLNLENSLIDLLASVVKLPKS